MKFLIPDASGHSTVEFDKAKPEDMERARAMFERLVRGEKKAAYSRKAPGGETRITRELDPDAEETVFFSPLAGG